MVRVARGVIITKRDIMYRETEMRGGMQEGPGEGLNLRWDDPGVDHGLIQFRLDMNGLLPHKKQ